MEPGQGGGGEEGPGMPEAVEADPADAQVGAYPSPPGPTLVLISTSSNVPRNSISYKITSRVPGEPEAPFITARLSGDHAALPVNFLLWEAGPPWEEQLIGTSVGWGIFPLDLQFLGKQAPGQQPP